MQERGLREIHTVGYNKGAPLRCQMKHLAEFERIGLPLSLQIHRLPSTILELIGQAACAELGEAGVDTGECHNGKFLPMHFMMQELITALASPSTVKPLQAEVAQVHHDV